MPDATIGTPPPGHQHLLGSHRLVPGSASSGPGFVGSRWVAPFALGPLDAVQLPFARPTVLSTAGGGFATAGAERPLRRRRIVRETEVTGSDASLLSGRVYAQADLFALVIRIRKELLFLRSIDDSSKAAPVIL